MEGLGCEVKLLRLRERCNDIKNVNKGFVKAVIFIDLKNAYDTVDHGILFNKLEKMNIRPRLIRVLKALYSSAIEYQLILMIAVLMLIGEYYKEVYYRLSYSTFI